MNTKEYHALNRSLFRVILLVLCSSVLVLGSFSASIQPISAAGYSAWLKIVTTSWKGTNDPWLLSGNFMPMFPAGEGFAERFNVTAQEAFVEVYSIKYDTLAVQHEGTFEPNATGFVKVSWTADPTEHAIMIVVKAKSYYGEKIGEGDLWDGIIMYALFLSPENPGTDWEKFNEWLGVKNIYGSSKPTANFSWNIKGEFVNNLYADSVNGFTFTGPLDFMTITATAFAEVFGNETEDGLPVNAWVAQTAKIFKLFHVHSWYSVKDDLSFAQIKIYDLDHTSPTSEASLIQAAVTGEDGQSRYTREIYPPEEGLDDGRFENNPFVPIPLQIFNLNNKTVFHGGIVAGQEVGAPHLNATIRVWWETVIVNQTIYYGKTVNGTLDAIQVTGLNKYVPTFAGPLNIWHNATNPDVDYPVVSFINATVFYAHFCTYDNDTAIKFPHEESIMLRLSESESIDVGGDQLIGALVAINLKTTGNESYYMTKNLLSTNETGCTDDPHKYRGGLYDDMARFPNATMWYDLYYEDPIDTDSVPEYFEDRGIASFWEKFGKYVWLNVSLMYNPADADNYDDIPEGPNLLDVKDPARIGDEDVLESSYYNGNWSKLVADVSYANTLTLKDDKPFTGMDILVSWKGGWRNIHPGNEELVGEIRVKNPYGIAAALPNWIPQLSFSISYDADEKIYKPDAATAKWITWDAPIVVLDEDAFVVDDVQLSRGRVNMTTYVYDIVFHVVDALGNPLPAAETEVDLRLPNGNFYAKVPSLDESLITGVYWSYIHFGEGNVTFFQLPGNKGPYGVRVLYQGIEVYYNTNEISVLTETTVVTVRTTIYKIKLVFYDCDNETIPQLWVKYTMPDGRTDWRQTSEHGEIEFPFFATGTLKISRVWWKGAEVPLMSAEEADGTEIPLNENNELIIEVTEEIDLPIKVYVPIKTLIFYTTDFQGETKIPYLNITLTWIGTYKPWTDEKVYFLETLDPTGDENDEPYNTSIVVHDLWFRYEVKTFFHKIANGSPMNNLVEYEAKYVFYKMPPAVYNVTVTTVSSQAYADLGKVSPAISKWSGRDSEVPYEIKIDWTWAEKYEGSIPRIRTAPADEVNDRVVLRVFGSMDGIPVTTENFPENLVEAWNPGLVGIMTNLTCLDEVKLRIWLHDFWIRVVDEEYLNTGVKLSILNDNGNYMDFYDVGNQTWIGNTYLIKTRENVKILSALNEANLSVSSLFWNGSYRVVVNTTNGYTNTTDIILVGNEELWMTDKRFSSWIANYSTYFVLYELPDEDDEHLMYDVGSDGKSVLPIPVITPYFAPQLHVDIQGTCGGNDPCFTTIGDALKRAGLNAQINVYPGTYTQNLMITKSIRLVAADPDQPPLLVPEDPSKPVITITSKSAFSVQLCSLKVANAINSSGILITNASHVTIKDVIISGNRIGILVHGKGAEGSSDLVIAGSSIQGNLEAGVSINGGVSNLTIYGNNIIDNEGGGIKIEANSTINAIRINFNHIYENGIGIDNPTPIEINAKNNWWGSANGPSILGSGTSTIDSVSGFVDFAPWLRAPLRNEADGSGVMAYRSYASPNLEVSFPETDVSVILHGSGAEIFVASYAQSPAEPISGMVQKWIDVYSPSIPEELNEVIVKLHYSVQELPSPVDESSLVMLYLSDSQWSMCSDSLLDVANDYVACRIRSDTAPSLEDLNALAFGLAVKWLPVTRTITLTKTITRTITAYSTSISTSIVPIVITITHTITETTKLTTKETVETPVQTIVIKTQTIPATTTFTHIRQLNFTKTVTTTATKTVTLTTEKTVTEDFANLLKSASILNVISSSVMLLAAAVVIITITKFRRAFSI